MHRKNRVITPAWSVRAEAYCGSPAQELIKRAEQWKPDLIVVGSHGRSALWRADSIFVGARGLSRIKRLLLGSVSAAVAARAHCSVEVIRPPLS